LFKDTIVELEITFDIMSGIDLGSEKTPQLSLADSIASLYNLSIVLGIGERPKIQIPDKAMIHSDFKENEEFQYSVDYVKHKKVKILIDMNTP
jgi:hypothetical protein